VMLAGHARSYDDKQSTLFGSNLGARLLHAASETDTLPEFPRQVRQENMKLAEEKLKKVILACNRRGVAAHLSSISGAGDDVPLLGDGSSFSMTPDASPSFAPKKCPPEVTKLAKALRSYNLALSKVLKPLRLEYYGPRGKARRRMLSLFEEELAGAAERSAADGDGTPAFLWSSQFLSGDIRKKKAYGKRAFGTASLNDGGAFAARPDTSTARTAHESTTTAENTDIESGPSALTQSEATATFAATEAANLQLK
jgi:hypothetical protein